MKKICLFFIVIVSVIFAVNLYAEYDCKSCDGTGFLVGLTKNCTKCGGSGELRGEVKVCEKCRGEKYEIDRFGDRVPCERCEGRGGYMTEGGRTCDKCNGSGEEKVKCPMCKGRGKKP